MRLRVGTSGFSYKEWKGSFYPEDLPAAKMLGFYSERFDTVEINNTFYRMPQPSVFEGWAVDVAAPFAFVLKAPMTIAHLKRSETVDATAKAFFAMARILGPRLGPILLQLPGNLKKDVERLRTFFELVPSEFRVAVDVGHESWLDEEIYEFLREKNAALCCVDDPKKRTPIVTTADWGYVRLREVDYDDAALKRWVKRIREQTWSEAWVFFKHEDEGTGPRLGARLKTLWEPRGKVASSTRKGMVGGKR